MGRQRGRINISIGLIPKVFYEWMRGSQFFVFLELCMTAWEKFQILLDIFILKFSFNIELNPFFRWHSIWWNFEQTCNSYRYLSVAQFKKINWITFKWTIFHKIRTFVSNNWERVNIFTNNFNMYMVIQLFHRGGLWYAVIALGRMWSVDALHWLWASS